MSLLNKVNAVYPKKNGKKVDHIKTVPAAVALADTKPAGTPPTTPAPSANVTAPQMGFSNPKPPSLPKVSGYPIPATVDETLSTILSWRRPHESEHESEFVEWLLGKCTTMGYKPTFMSSKANVVVEVPLPDGARSTTLFSSHTDTVHRSSAKSAPQRQSVAYDTARGELFLQDPQTGDCLGADDGAGVWLMMEMIRNKVPGTYIFHRGEERGCIGSTAMAHEKALWLGQFDIAVAFDRKGFTEIITHQSGLRCASEKCSNAFLAQLHKHGLRDMELSTRGTVTDTLKYRKIIPECYNLAVGYGSNHGPNEYLDYAYLVALRDALVKVEWDTLPVDRDPKEPDPVSYPSGGYGFGGQDDFGFGFPSGGSKPGSKFVSAPSTSSSAKPQAVAAAKALTSVKDDPFKNPLDPVGEFMSMTDEDMADYITNWPEDAVKDIDAILLELMRTRAERDFYKKRGGFA